MIHEETRRGIRFTFSVEAVSGEEGEQLAITQTRALRELLVWARQNRSRPGTPIAELERGSERGL